MSGKNYSIETAMREVQQDIKAMTQEIETRAKAALGILAAQTHAKIIEKAQEKLRSTRQTYLDALVRDDKSGTDVYIIGLKKEAAWIEEGQAAGERIEAILKGGKPAKTVKSGEHQGQRYKIIPFKHNKSPQNTSLAQMRIANFAKNEIRKQGLDKPIMKDGQPVIGRAATVKIDNSKQPVSRFNKPLLAGLTIYQKKDSKGNVKRDVMTFRVIGEWQKGSGLWEWKEMKGAHIFDEVMKEVDKEWEKMVKEILDSISTNTTPNGGV